MKCQGCNKNLASSLSICPGCGTMVNDSAREELLQLNISGPLGTARRVPPSSGTLEVPGVPVKPPVRPPIAPPVITGSAPAMPAPAIKVETAKLPVKDTNPTLVGFQNNNASLPDWRLKLQNAVRQRSSGGISVEAVGTPEQQQPAAYQKHLVTSGANALKAEYMPEAAPAANESANPRLAAALKRIEQSRQLYAEPAAPPQKAAPPAQATKNYPFNVVTPSVNPPARPVAERKATVNVLPKPKLVSSLRLGKEVLDTNKLPPIPESIKISSSFDKPFSPQMRDSGPLSDEVIHIPKAEDEFIDETPVEMIEAEVETAIDVESEIDNEVEIEIEKEKNEIEDLAPFAVRFNAGLFDLIIGGFASLMLLSPFVLMGGNWFTWAGFFGFLTTSAVVMFIYLTTSIGLFGKTLGMRIFSLEVVDIEESDYPTFHQAALSSTLYLLSLAFGGIGFLTIPFNEEKRAVHDLLSGTIVVKEF